MVGPLGPSTQVPLHAWVTAPRQAHVAGSHEATAHAADGRPPVSLGVIWQ